MGDKSIKGRSKLLEGVKKAMLKRIQEIGTEEKLPPSQKPSFGPSRKFLKRKRMQKNYSQRVSKNILKE